MLLVNMELFSQTPWFFEPPVPTVAKIQFILFHYVQLATFTLAAYGAGCWFVRYAVKADEGDRILRACLSVCVGMGGFIVALQVLGILGLLNATAVGILILAGIVSFIGSRLQLPQDAESSGRTGMTPAIHRKTDWFYLALPLALAAELLLRPLTPPLAWDELMYHLPHARDWAASGKLQVNESLRFPLFPYNFNLLYAASLTVSDDILPHMLHAMAGALVAIGLYRLAAAHFGRPVGSIAVLFFVAATRIEFGNAYVDLGLAAFLFFSLTCLFGWYETRRFGYLCLAVFLFGVAAGIKHQALVFAPLILAAVVWRERRLLRLAWLAALFAVPCIYWYVRSYLVSGDPLHPLGAAVFGYWQWGPQDTANVIADIKRVYGWPSWTVLLGLGAIAFRARMGNLLFRSTLIFAIYAFVTWMLTSHYPRYLLPAFPALCLLSAIVICDIAVKTAETSRFGKLLQRKGGSDTASTVLKAAVLAILCVASASTAVRQWQDIQPTEQERGEFLRKRIQSYEVSEFLRANPGYRIVQIGLESDLYYLPTGTLGDHFGPARYSDLLALAPAELARKIQSMGANALLISSREAAVIPHQSGFASYFEPVKKTEGAELYRVR